MVLGDRTFAESPGFLGFSLTGISEGVGIPLAGLLGADLLRDFADGGR